MVQPRVAQRLVAGVEVGLVDRVGAAQALGDVVAGQLDVHAARVRAELAVHLEEAADLVHHVLEPAGLVAVGRGHGVAVHGVGDPHRLQPRVPDALDDAGQHVPDPLRAHAGDEGQAARLALRVQPLGELEGIRGRGGRAELHADRVADPGEEVDVGAVHLAGALADPQEVGARGVGVAAARVHAGQGALVVEQERLVGRVELGAAHGLEVHARGVHEADRAVDLGGHLLVLGVGRVGHEALVPLVHAAQIGEAALGEGADQVQGGGGGVVRLHHPSGVVPACLLGELVAVHDLAAEAGQRDAVAGLRVRGPRLGELAGDPAHLHDRHGGAVGQHRGHLQDGLHPGADPVGGGPGERLGAVAALQEERAALGDVGQTGAQQVDLAREDERGQGAQLGDGGAVIGLVRPGRRLCDRQRAPVVQAGDVGGALRDGGAEGQDLLAGVFSHVHQARGRVPRPGLSVPG